MKFLILLVVMMALFTSVALAGSNQNPKGKHGKHGNNKGQGM